MKLRLYYQTIIIYLNNLGIAIVGVNFLGKIQFIWCNKPEEGLTKT